MLRNSDHGRERAQTSVIRDLTDSSEGRNPATLERADGDGEGVAVSAGGAGGAGVAGVWSSVKVAMVDCGDGSWGREREAWEVGEQKWFEGREFYGWCGAEGVARTKTVGFVVSRPNLDGQCIAQCVAESGHPDTGHFAAYLCRHQIYALHCKFIQSI